MFDRFSLRSDPSTPFNFLTGSALFRRVLLYAGILFASLYLFVGVWRWIHSSSGRSDLAGSRNTRSLSMRQLSDTKKFDETQDRSKLVAHRPAAEPNPQNSKPVNQDVLTFIELMRSRSRSEPRTGTSITSDQTTKAQDSPRSALNNHVDPSKNEPRALLANDSQKKVSEFLKRPVHGGIYPRLSPELKRSSSTRSLRPVRSVRSRFGTFYMF
ncbi:hypothetical protein A6X21_07540 [Planctopirus hydrillae]|uniref:Uncharacterized protein n=1 Tax=Planctopirus hydrillae TaxID=1841610 RepID=A0A1C3E926_9PLAN|nr:hypothetical protein A6X21_07540 [Planctopirus hydrillae]